MAECPDCGAHVADGEACRSLFDRLLAHEYDFPEAFGAVHHLTAAAYTVQHARGYSREAIDCRCGWLAGRGHAHRSR